MVNPIPFSEVIESPLNKIIVNKARCKICDDVMYSTDQESNTTCDCLACFIAGGQHHLVRGVRVDILDHRQISEVIEELTEYAG
jgi:hypothetical protein